MAKKPTRTTEEEEEAITRGMEAAKEFEEAEQEALEEEIVQAVRGPRQRKVFDHTGVQPAVEPPQGPPIHPPGLPLPDGPPDMPVVVELLRSATIGSAIHPAGAKIETAKAHAAMLIDTGSAVVAAEQPESETKPGIDEDTPEPDEDV